MGPILSLMPCSTVDQDFLGSLVFIAKPGKVLT